jgi:hypothetical protein
LRLPCPAEDPVPEDENDVALRLKNDVDNVVAGMHTPPVATVPAPHDTHCPFE